MAKRVPAPISWRILNARGGLANLGEYFRVTTEREFSAWWNGRKATFQYESYATREQAEARVAELTASNARKLDAARTLTWDQATWATRVASTEAEQLAHEAAGTAKARYVAPTPSQPSRTMREAILFSVPA